MVPHRELPVRRGSIPRHSSPKRSSTRRRLNLSPLSHRSPINELVEDAVCEDDALDFVPFGNKKKKNVAAAMIIKMTTAMATSARPTANLRLTP